MPSRLIPQTESMKDLLAQPYGSQEIVNQNPKWALQRKARNENDLAMQDKHVLKEGFAGFYGAAAEPVLKIGDTVRRHITRPGGKEAEWRPSCRPIDPFEHPPKAYGKRAVMPPSERHHEEIDDVPRGRRRCEPPVDQLPAEAPMFQLKHTVRDPENGKRWADRMSDLDAKQPPRGPKLVAPESRRNGQPQATAGDKPYSAVELSSEYMASSNPMRSRMEPVVSNLPPIDRWAANEARKARVNDIDQVRSLPSY